MKTLTIRGIEDGLKQNIRMRAAANGRSMEQEVRTTLASVYGAAPVDAKPRRNLGAEARRIAAEVGGIELDLPPRGPSKRGFVDFGTDEAPAGE